MAIRNSRRVGSEPMRSIIMPGVFKRGSNKSRGKAGKWTCWWHDEHGVVRQKTGTTDKATSLEVARKNDSECRRVKEGIIDRRDLTVREAAGQPLGSHIDAYSLWLLSKGDGKNHARHIKGALKRLCRDAQIGATGDLDQEMTQAALKRLSEARSARTANHARGAFKAFVSWLHSSGRIKELPRWLPTIRAFNEKIDRKLVRRALSPDEVERLLEATRSGMPIVARRASTKLQRPKIDITGLEREMLYRIAMATGFRANEIAQLNPEDFDLGGSPVIRAKASYTKNHKEDAQPIKADLAELLRPWIAFKKPSEPVLVFPLRTAQMLRVDLASAGIEAKNHHGTVDFHALRHSYITNLIMSGADPKTVQVLARHSTITLTIDRYAHTDDERKRRAIETA